MGERGRFKRPHLPTGRLRDLNNALHSLHLAAGLPSTAAMSKDMGHTFTRSCIHDAFTKPQLPSWDVVDCLIEVLGKRAPTTTPEEMLGEVHALWVLAAADARRGQGGGPLGDEAVREEVTDIVAHLFNVRPRDLGPATRFREDLGVDSLAALELSVSIERRFHVRMSPIETVVSELLCVGDLVDFVCHHIRVGTAADPT
ncbi:acyl carrier protein [Streptomyces zhihengii]|uniref:acyl carrier protein n=1 Tax=Streptomyces zhihengii TaxID=1818004 RepID=UPI003456A667